MRFSVFILLILTGAFSPVVSAERCEVLFENSHHLLPSRPPFIDPGLGIVYPKKPSDPVAVRIKITRDDLYSDSPIRQQAAKILNVLFAPISAALGAHQLTGVVNKLMNDTRSVPYPIKLAEAFSLKIKTSFRTAIEQIPSEGPVIVVSPHPLAGIDAMALASITSAVRKKPDTLIVLIDSLKELPGIHENAILIDVSGTYKGKVKNKLARDSIIDHLKNGGCIVLFPSGSNSSMGPNGKLIDAAWKPGLFDFASETPDAVIVPMSVSGKLSNVYYQTKAVNPKLVTALLPRELAAQIGSTIEVRIGNGILASTALQIAKSHVDQTIESDKMTHLQQIKNAFLGFLKSQVIHLGNSSSPLDEPVSPSELYLNNR